MVSFVSIRLGLQYRWNTGPARCDASGQSPAKLSRRTWRNVPDPYLGRAPAAGIACSRRQAHVERMSDDQIKFRDPQTET